MFTLTPENMNRELTIQFILMIVGAISALWNIFVYLSAKKSRKESKKSEEQALKHAQQADKYYKKVIEFYNNEEKKQEIELELLKKAQIQQEHSKLKHDVFSYVRKKGSIRTSQCAKALNLSNEEAFDILYDLLRVDKAIGSGGNPDRKNVDQNIWRSNR